MIFLSFAGITAGSIEGMKATFKKINSDEYMRHEEMLKTDTFGDKERKYYDRVEPNMSDDIAYMAINSLCIYLEKYYHKKVIILLDEYDTPMQEAWLGRGIGKGSQFFQKLF